MQFLKVYNLCEYSQGFARQVAPNDIEILENGDAVTPFLRNFRYKAHSIIIRSSSSEF